ncbi:MAG: radical SAM protein [Desulfobacterales bacterium]|nr:radical SAM protein [Desulfobacterales bacterium]
MGCPYCYVMPKVHEGPELEIEYWIELLKKLIVKFSAKNICVHIAGGEVFIKRGILDLLRWLIENKVPVTVVSNGLFIPEEVFDETCFRLSKGFFTLEVSIDGLKEEHELMRRDFGAVIKNFERLLQNKIDTAVRTTVYRGNLKGMLDFHRYLDSMGKRLNSVIPIDIQPVMKFPKSKISKFQEIRLDLRDYLEEGVKVSKYSEENLKFVDSKWVFIEEWMGLNKIPDSIPIEGAFYGCSSGYNLQFMANGDVSSCEMAPPFFYLDSDISQIDIDLLAERLDRQLLPQKRCFSCYYKSVCGMCRLTPLVHGYTRGFGFKDCISLMKALVDFYEEQVW